MNNYLEKSTLTKKLERDHRKYFQKFFNLSSYFENHFWNYLTLCTPIILTHVWYEKLSVWNIYSHIVYWVNTSIRFVLGRWTKYTISVRSNPKILNIEVAELGKTKFRSIPNSEQGMRNIYIRNSSWGKEDEKKTRKNRPYLGKNLGIWI